MNAHVISEKRGSLGLLTLNRPQALNALTHDMIRALATALTDWAGDDAIRCVAIRGEGRAFCAGGDVRAVRQAVLDGTGHGAALLGDEYRLNALIGSYPKPYIALMHGITMGGGAGVSVHGSHRLADPELVFAMPEAAIGFIPDVGASHFLSRLPGEDGALSGADRRAHRRRRCAGPDHPCRGADGFRRRDRRPGARRGARGADRAGGAQAAAGRAGAASPPHPDDLFRRLGWKPVLERLDRDGSAFARNTAQAIRAVSPTSVKLTFRLLREAAHLDLKQCLELEYRLAQRVIVSPDFREGVRAALVHKDRSPHWNPPSLAAVGATDAFFAPARDALF